MLTGVKAFDGPTVTDVLAAVVTGEPDWKKLPAATTDSVRRLLRRCLEKDPKRRLRDAGDASLLLEDDPHETKPAFAARVAPRTTPVLVASVLLAIAVSGAVGWRAARRQAEATSARELTFQRITFARGMVRAARFAPDGKTIVYGAAWDGPPIKLYLTRTDSTESTPIVMPPGELLSVSKNGELAVALGLAYVGWMGDGTLARTALLGGSPREVEEHVRAADWSPDGSTLAIVHRVNGLDQLEYPAGNILHKTAGYIADVRVSPDGERVAFADHPIYADNRGDVAVVDRSGHKTVLAADFAAILGIAWSLRNDELWFVGVRGDPPVFALYAGDLSGHRRVIHSSISPIELFDVAADGRVLLGSHHNERSVVAVLDGFSEARNMVVPGEASLARYLSPDGRAVLISNHLPKEYETYVVRSDRAGATRLSAGDGTAISPDGTSAVAISADGMSMTVTPLGMGATHSIPNPNKISYEGLPVWLPDNKRVVVTGRIGADSSRGFVGDVASGDLKPFGVPGLHWDLFTPPPVSPDGKQVILQDTSGAPARWPIEGGEPLAIPGLLPGDLPLAFTDDGAALFVGETTVPITITRLDLAKRQARGLENDRAERRRGAAVRDGDDLAERKVLGARNGQAPHGSLRGRGIAIGYPPRMQRALWIAWTWIALGSALAADAPIAASPSVPSPAVRTLYLVRHGVYDPKSAATDDPLGPGITPLVSLKPVCSAHASQLFPASGTRSSRARFGERKKPRASSPRIST
jgi:hypothetical protein